MDEGYGYPPLKRQRFDWKAEQPGPEAPLTDLRPHRPLSDEPSSQCTAGYSVTAEVQPGLCSSRQELVPPNLHNLLNPVEFIPTDEASPPHESNDETVCFGVISGLNGFCEDPPLSESTGPIPIHLDSPSRFTAADKTSFRGSISELVALVQELFGDEVLQLTAFCTLDKPVKTQRKHARVPCKVDLYVSGPFSFFEDLGDWLEESDVYLQDPRILTQDIKYCNPHRLSFAGLDNCLKVSQVVSRTAKAIYLRDITDTDDFLDNYFSSEVQLEETEQPQHVVTPLKRHQKQALTFMLRREEGWSMQGPYKDIWTIRDSDQGRLFVNTISQSCYQEPPKELYGGILADPMGLGKTLTVISLAAIDVESDDSARLDQDELISSHPSVPTTLIIVPPSLLGTWEEQITQHTDGLRFHRHHGKTKLANSSDVSSFHIVLTTFDRVSIEWRALKGSASESVLFAVRWRRIILDEAHIIRNEVSQRSKAICDLESRSRWAVTGTPIQNQLNDLATLLKFIRAHPYHEKRKFEEDIGRILKDGDPKQEGVERLQRLSSCLLLRRPKKTIQLPRRRDMECPVEFTAQEREKYNELKDRAVMSIDRALEEGTDVNRSGVYVNMLQQIESLRLFCNLGMQYHTRHDNNPQLVRQSSGVTEWGAVAQQAFKSHLEMASASCLRCKSVQSLTDVENLFDETPQQKKPLFSRCLRYVCGECASTLRRNGGAFQCGHASPCPAVSVSTSIYSLEDASDAVPEPQLPLESFPSKVIALVTDIQSQPSDVKCIVFSSWRLTLNVVEAALKQASVCCLRFDGKVPHGERESVMQKFKQDPSVRVLLLTLACGNFGLTLTEASRAYLMEPQWNPNIEEQAFGRIHRMGQTREVTTVRFYIRPSFEERVKEVQQCKKRLAEIILSPHDGGHSSSSIERLQKLRSLL